MKTVTMKSVIGTTTLLGALPSDSAKRPNQDFVNAVCKMQNRQKDKLTSRGKRAMKKWVDKTKVASSRANASSANLTLAERMTKKRGKKGSKEDKKRKADSNSISDSTDDDDVFDRIFDTAAEVEQLWSIARYILTD